MLRSAAGHGDSYGHPLDDAEVVLGKLERIQAAERTLETFRTAVEEQRRLYGELSRDSLVKHLQDRNRGLTKRLRGMRKHVKQQAAWFAEKLLEATEENG